MTEPLPERARLFHIGPPKTGTTALQAAAAASRPQLLEHGVRYPGRAYNQRAAVAEFLNRRVTWYGAGYDQPSPAPRHWPRLMAEIEADQERRIWFGHEYAAGADDAMMHRFAEAIGPRIEVVITLRHFATMLPSIWQETNKAGNVGKFDRWLVNVLGRGKKPATNARFAIRHDHGALVRRWVNVVGADHVTVVVLDPSDPQFVFTAFEELLALPCGLLSDSAPSVVANRSLSEPEAELLRLTNAELRRHSVSWPEYRKLIVGGAARRMLTQRQPTADEPRVRLPEWAEAVANERARRYVEEIGNSGARILGDLNRLNSPPGQTGPRSPQKSGPVENRPAWVPMDAAVAALTGITSAALNRGFDFASPTSPSTELNSTAPVPVRDLPSIAGRSLAAALGRRLPRLRMTWHRFLSDRAKAFPEE